MIQKMSCDKGFTLLELIIAIIITAIMGSMLVSFTGTALTQSAVPAINMARFYEQNKLADKIIADYKADYLAGFANPLANFVQKISGSPGYNTNYISVGTQFIQYDQNFNISNSNNNTQGLLRVTLTPAPGQPGGPISFLLVE
ncbi:MAG: prepilin-type N-terminal cleavage/methylation domain-containing protein [Desulfobacteraceae bacterium]|nr:prepilin-type N-terminal cleavage/methylation domain-containing protein [Desulfobacteraceae bacterium]